MKNFKLFSIITAIMFLMSCNADWLEVKPSDRLV
jgi:hypothetical protein